MTDDLGWSLPDAPGSILEAARWLARGRQLLGAEGLMALGEVARGEQVFLELRDERILLSDRGETCRYLEAGDAAHRRLEEADIRRLCRERGALLVAVEDMWPHITVSATEDVVLADAVRVIGEAIEHVFESAVDVPRRG